jgi:hypothetical protein
MRSYKGFSIYFTGHVITLSVEPVVDKLGCIPRLEVRIFDGMKEKLLSKTRLFTYKHKRKTFIF